LKWEIVLPLMVTVFLAFTGYLVTYFRSLKLSQRKENLEYVERQLRLLYGPLYGLISSSSIVYKEFLAAEMSGASSFWSNGNQPTQEQAAKWRKWVVEIFMPMNAGMVEVILENSDLIEGSEMPDCFQKLCAHYYGYKSIIKAWEENDFSEHTSILKFPGEEMQKYVVSSFKVLKKRQLEIINYRTS